MLELLDEVIDEIVVIKFVRLRCDGEVEMCIFIFVFFIIIGRFNYCFFMFCS